MVAGRVRQVIAVAKFIFYSKTGGGSFGVVIMDRVVVIDRWLLLGRFDCI